jgi:hypothetical protein
VTVVSALFAAMSMVLLLSGAILVYTALSGVQVVVYRKAVFALGASAMLLVVGWLVSDLTYHGFLETRVLYVVSDGILTVGAAVHLWAVWLFARDFVQFESESTSIEVGYSNGGFEDE